MENMSGSLLILLLILALICYSPTREEAGTGYRQQAVESQEENLNFFAGLLVIVVIIFVILVIVSFVTPENSNSASINYNNYAVCRT